MEKSSKALLIIEVQNGFVNDATRHIVPKSRRFRTSTRMSMPIAS